VPISAALRQGPHFEVIAVAIRWQRVGNLIGSEHLNSTPPAPDAPLVPNNT